MEAAPLGSVTTASPSSSPCCQPSASSAARPPSTSTSVDCQEEDPQGASEVSIQVGRARMVRLGSQSWSA